VHDGLDWTAPTEQTQHHQHELRRALEAEQRRPTRGGERAPTPAAQIAPLLQAVHPDCALADLATGRTVQVRAKCVLRAHRSSPIDMRGILTSNRRGRGPVTRRSSAPACPDHGSLWRYHMALEERNYRIGNA